jgi:hypothetical protein
MHRQMGESIHLLGDLITFTIKRADVRTADLALDRLGDRLVGLVRRDLGVRPTWGEVFADEVAYHATRIARACLETNDEENLASLVGLVERVAIALLETGHGQAAYPLLRQLVYLGRELVRRADGDDMSRVLEAIARVGATVGEEPGSHLVDAAAAALGSLGASAAGVRFEAEPLDADDAWEPSRVAIDRLDVLGRLAVDRGLEAAAEGVVAATGDIARAAAEADSAAASLAASAVTLRRLAEHAGLAGRPAPVAAAVTWLAALAEVGRRLDRAPVVEAALRALASLGAALEPTGLVLPAAPGGEAGPASALCATTLARAGDGFEYLVARALRGTPDGPFRRRFQGTLAPA